MGTGNHEDRARTDVPADAEQAAETSREARPELEQATKERDDYLKRWQRAAADYQNLKRRTAGEVDNAVRRSLEQLLLGLLVVVDHLELALGSPADSDDGRTLLQGVRLTRDQLHQVLHKEGVEPILDQETFDPNLHQAVATLESDELEPGRVVDVLRRGYTWRGQVLRAAHVRVSRAPLSAAEGAPD